MFLVYDLIFLLFTLAYLPVFLLKRKFHPGFSARLGIYKKDLQLNRPIWIHAVSVGETMVVRGLLHKLRQVYPEKKFVISTVTPTGNKVACSMAKDDDYVTYLPLDFSGIVNRVLTKINPALFILAETEIWPNLISSLKKKNIPIVIVNGRISDASFKGYSCVKLFLRPILEKINLFCVQTELDAQRLRCLGVAQDKICITGNMKFDSTDDATKKDYSAYRLKLGLQVKDKLLVCGSTHPGEEKMILDAYRQLLADFSDLKLFIAPRHPQRSAEIESLVKEFGWVAQRISLLNLPVAQAVKPPCVFILDTIGELLAYYAISDIAFVGGSLIKKGGHNILEPAFLGKPVLFGPYMFNFRDVAQLFLKNQAAMLVHNPLDLKENIKLLLAEPGRVSALTQSARELIRQNQGATQKTLECILGIKGLKAG